ncbi:MAG: four helix bundle protein [Deltaproteobacteria bacterium]|nr:four helix bundle protein [Deltaproteobacteria bacterium]
MASIRSFNELDAWCAARELTKLVYLATRGATFSKDFGLRDQIRRASVSIMANIAEGFGRSGSVEFIQFLAIAKGSACEVLSHVYVAFDQDYVTQAEFDRLSLIFPAARCGHRQMGFPKGEDHPLWSPAGLIPRRGNAAFIDLAERTVNLIGGLPKYLRQSTIKGAKYKR